MRLTDTNLKRKNQFLIKNYSPLENRPGTNFQFDHFHPKPQCLLALLKTERNLDL